MSSAGEEDQNLRSTEEEQVDNSMEATTEAETNEAAETGQEQQETPQSASEEAPTMSPEHTLLLQVLRRAKRQQDLIIEVQKSLKALAVVEKSIGKTTEQIKQLQSAVKETQKQIVQAQRQIAAVERAQTKGFQKMAKQRGGVLPTTGAKVAAAARKKKNKSKKKQ